MAAGFGAVMLGPLAPLVWAILLVVYLRQHPDAAARALFLKRAAFVVVAASAGFFALFAAGEALTDPGGWKGLALVASWAVPAALLAVAGWSWPQRASVVFVVLTAAVIALDVWYASNPDGWRSFEDEHGPVSTIATFVVVATTAFLAWRRPTVGGMLMLAVPITSLTLAAFVHELGPAALAAAAGGALPGALFLLSAYYERRAGPPPATTGLAGADAPPRAA